MYSMVEPRDSLSGRIHGMDAPVRFVDLAVVLAHAREVWGDERRKVTKRRYHTMVYEKLVIASSLS